MSIQAPQNLALDEFLVAVSSRDLHGKFVVPKPDVAGKLTQEIEQRTGIKSRNMACENGVETVQHWISAMPENFPTQARKMMDDICTLLRQSAAKTFEIVFHNTQQGPNEWGDQVLFAVRYDRTAAKRNPLGQTAPREAR